MPREPFVYLLNSARVIDGDTIEAVVDQGLHVLHKVRIRLADINCPEAGTPEGDEATRKTQQWLDLLLSTKTRVTVTTLIRDKQSLSFERWIGSIEDSSSGERLEDYLVKVRCAKPSRKSRRSISS